LEDLLLTSTMLQTMRGGRSDGNPCLVLHDRYGMLADSRQLAAELAPPDALTICIQAPRLQTSGGVGKAAGYYWYVGPRERPELTSLGDTLFHLEKLLLNETASGRKACLIGKGEGGSVALLSAMTWPEKVMRVIAIDAALPGNLDRLPIEWPGLEGLEVELVGERPDSGTVQYLIDRGANVRHRQAAEPT
jgi:hypothetical protein